eukprot:3940702-Rhodomonas_salina.1
MSGTELGGLFGTRYWAKLTIKPRTTKGGRAARRARPLPYKPKTAKVQVDAGLLGKLTYWAKSGGLLGKLTYWAKSGTEPTYGATSLLRESVAGAKRGGGEGEEEGGREGERGCAWRGAGQKGERARVDGGHLLSAPSPPIP